jgi:hypothetical protein
VHGLYRMMGNSYKSAALADGNQKARHIRERRVLSLAAGFITRGSLAGQVPVLVGRPVQEPTCRRELHTNWQEITEPVKRQRKRKRAERKVLLVYT